MSKILENEFTETQDAVEQEIEKRYFYAELNSENVAVNLLETGTKTELEIFVPLDSFDMSVLGKRWENGTWVEVPQPEPEPIPLTDEQIAIFEAQINTEYLVCLSELNLM